MKLGILFITLLILSPVLAQTTDELGEASNQIQTFLITFAPELSALGVAAIAAMGIKVALKKVPNFGDDNVLNGVVVAIFLAIFVLVYTSGLVIFFAPAVGFMVLAGFGSILWAIRKGMTDTGGEMKSFGNIIGGLGCLLLAWFAMQVSTLGGGGTAMTWAAIGFGVIGAVLLFVGAKELDLFKGLKSGSSAGTSSAIVDTDDIDDEKIDDEAEDEAEKITDDNFDTKVDEVKNEVKELIKKIDLSKEELIKALEGLKP
ncbi:MAG TPA: hypothetical protein VI790_01765 [Candidatus Nanoarchaeia archaeon]|nr:hypothetical protein [Candidatus Nanoarchaeia archaeon]